MCPFMHEHAQPWEILICRSCDTWIRILSLLDDDVVDNSWQERLTELLNVLCMLTWLAVLVLQRSSCLSGIFMIMMSDDIFALIRD